MADTYNLSEVIDGSALSTILQDDIIQIDMVVPAFETPNASAFGRYLQLNQSYTFVYNPSLHMFDSFTFTLDGVNYVVCPCIQIFDDNDGTDLYVPLVSFTEMTTTNEHGIINYIPASVKNGVRTPDIGFKLETGSFNYFKINNQDLVTVKDTEIIEDNPPFQFIALVSAGVFVVLFIINRLLQSLRGKTSYRGGSGKLQGRRK